MLLRFTLSAAGAMVLASTATAQLQNGTVSPITSQVKDAGVYHMATGTWTRNTTASALVGPSALYDNSCTVGYYTGLAQGDIMGDSGRIPSQSDGGLADAYHINCFSLAYCTFEPVVTTLGLSYYDCYAACDGFLAQTPVQAYALVNVPAGGTAGTQGCWILTFDLTNTTFGFDLAGDCNGTFDNVASTDSFGWTWTQLSPTTGSNAGPILAGDPLGVFNASCGVIGEDTDHPGWGPAAGLPGNGIGVLDQFEIDGGATTGCFWFGGYGAAGLNPMAALYHELFGEGGSTTENQGTGFCAADGSQGVCPGGVTNSGTPGGCPHISGPNGGAGCLLTPTGNATFGSDTYGFSVTAGPSSLGILIQGAVALGYPNGNITVPNSAGKFCVNPQLRGFVETTPLGAGSDEAAIDDFRAMPFGATAIGGGATTYNQFWFRDTGNPNANPGVGAEFNFSNAVETIWIP